MCCKQTFSRHACYSSIADKLLDSSFSFEISFNCCLSATEQKQFVSETKSEYEFVVICMTNFLNNAVLQIYHASCLHQILSRWVKNLQSYRKKTNMPVYFSLVHSVRCGYVSVGRTISYDNLTVDGRSG